jgi:hypothetical protein
MRDLCSNRLPKPHLDLGGGQVSPFFRRDVIDLGDLLKVIGTEDVIADSL